MSNGNGNGKYPPSEDVPARHRRVDFWDDVDDHTCVLLASLGFSTKYICERTDLSPSQVTYRLKKAGLTQENHTSRLDFRNGTSPMANIVLGQVRQVADAQTRETFEEISVTWKEVDTYDNGTPAGESWFVCECKNGRIYLEKRPGYCDRGRYWAKPDITFDKDVPGTYIDWQDGWPRYYFDLTRAKLEIEAWIHNRGLAL